MTSKDDELLKSLDSLARYNGKTPSGIAATCYHQAAAAIRKLESDLASERAKRVEAEARLALIAESDMVPQRDVDDATDNGIEWMKRALAAEATIEQARIEADRLHAWIDVHPTLVLRERGLVVSGRLQEVLANAGTSALARHDAEVWDKGWGAGWANRHQAKPDDEGYVGAVLPVVNPYRGDAALLRVRAAEKREEVK